jgi:hypothetical protein
MITKEELQDSKILALSWKQPYAELMMHGKVETRSWDTKYRGLVLICASKVPYTLAEVSKLSGDQVNPRFAQNYILNYPKAAAVCIGRLIETWPMEEKDEIACMVKYRPGLYCHKYSDIQRIEHIDWKGSQKWKVVPKSIIDQIKFML